MSRGGGDVMRRVCVTGLGSGYSPIASGTAGSFVAAVLFGAAWWAAVGTGAQRWTLDVALTVAVLLATGLGVAWGDWAVARFGSTDPKHFTLDEFAGQWLALLGLPLGLDGGLTAWLYVAGGQFFLFRVFDVLKPPPARQAERLPGGWGITFDDLFAGAYANVLGQLVWRLTPLAGWLGLRAAIS